LLTRRIYGAYLRLVLFGLLFLLATGVAAAALAGIAIAAFGSSLQGEAREIAGALAGVALYVVAMLGLSALYQTIVRLTLWRQVVDTAELEGLAALDSVRASGAPGSAVGEGLADALNVGGI
jgi:hypothetical protein